jgi:hypothetical protein
MHNRGASSHFAPHAGLGYGYDHRGTAFFLGRRISPIHRGILPAGISAGVYGRGLGTEAGPGSEAE